VNEIIIALLDSVMKLLDPDRLYELFKKRKKEELGAKLFMLYAVIDDIYVDGNQIVADLEEYVKTMDAYVNVDRQRWALGGLKQIRFSNSHIERQLKNINMAATTLQQLQTELHIIDPIGYMKAKVLMSGISNGKMGYLEALNSAPQLWQQGQLVLFGPTGQKLLDVATEIAQELGVDATNLVKRNSFDEKPQDRLTEIVAEIRKEFENGAVYYSGLWDEAVFRTVQSYLANRNPRDQLEQIRAVSAQIREALEKLFLPADILWLVGSRKFRSSYGL
jgi:hypothetical protein